MKDMLFTYLVICESVTVLNTGIPTIEPSRSEEIIQKKQSVKNVMVHDFNSKNKSDMVRIRSDMLLTKEQTDELYGDIQEEQGSRVKRHAYAERSYPNNLWPDNKVYFVFYPNASEGVKRVIRKVAGEWAKETCLEFEEIKLDDVTKVPNVIGVYSSRDCFSPVGKIGAIQGLSLADSCETVGHAAHELGHALGLTHTHRRYDRDRFIKINSWNILRVWLDRFSKVSNESTNNYIITYDFGSIMQFPATSESRNGKNTMELHDKNYLQTLGSHMIPFYDKLMVNRHYNCLDRCNVERKWWQAGTAKCKNGGFPNPKDCTTCVCPSGYGGKLCDRRPKGCGRRLLATTKLQALVDTVGYGCNNYERNDEYKMCNYWIEGLPGSTIEVNIRSYDVATNGRANEGCRESGVKIKTGNDAMLTGYRFCRFGQHGITLRSGSHVVPVITYSAVEDKHTILSYRIVYFDPNFKCEDSRMCSFFKKLNICESGIYSDTFRREVCAKTCGFCI